MRGGRIFISYRRTDSPAHTGRLKDRLAAHFRERVFQDVDSIAPGVEWDEEIARNLSQSGACIVIVGPGWLNAEDGAGNRRLDDHNDIVRQEIAVVLKREMRVFPVLVGGARMPELVGNSHKSLPVAASNAWIFRSLVPPLNTKPPLVASMAPQFSDVG